tara:strand:- start:900 stop:1142 length:243 start_codon:yes stop_codon:yes gene_type:complete
VSAPTKTYEHSVIDGPYWWLGTRLVLDEISEDPEFEFEVEPCAEEMTVLSLRTRTRKAAFDVSRASWKREVMNYQYTLWL